ncbi:MAG: S1 RNA-binding domain-containing protein [bacterium]|nr:S1 RNA-binding domain-containing protein [bacterium]
MKMYSNEEFEALLAQYDYSFKKGDIVKGVVCGFEADGAIIDIGSKCMAFAPNYEIVPDKKTKPESVLEKAQKYEFLITQDCDENGRFVVSYKKVYLAHAWAELLKIKEADETISVTITQQVKGGLIVDVSGIQGFIPQGQLYSKETATNVGDKINVRILTLDKAQNNLILSNKKVYDTNMAETRKNVFAQIEIGQIVKGEVVRITDFGAFVNIGGVDCLLPLSQISWKWVEHPTDLLTVGQEINVEIIDIDHDKQRISLSLKNTEPDPWIKAEAELHEGEVTNGIVTRIKAFGAFVEVLPGVEALLPQSALTELQNTNGKIVKAGDTIDTKIIKFNPKDKRISLGLPNDTV